MADIVVVTREGEGDWEFDIVVSDDDSETKHKVTMSKVYYNKLGTDTLPDEIVKKSFEFLLDRESKEMILSEFNIEVIAKYFPEFSDEARGY